MVKFATVGDVKDTLENEEEKLKLSAQGLVVLTGGAAFFTRRAVKNRLEKSKCVEAGAESHVASTVVTASLGALAWVTYKACSAGTSNGMKAGALVGIIASLIGIGAGEVIAWFAEKKDDNSNNNNSRPSVTPQ